MSLLKRSKCLWNFIMINLGGFNCSSKFELVFKFLGQIECFEQFLSLKR